ncbi:MAG: Rpn family recombination-promoting nuclease/putative transposase, partial [Saprospiraceae bacterium]|nr:Rpn family recombination-promoting nuclease/putative transposase [Saprospiraceae bacterium]
KLPKKEGNPFDKIFKEIFEKVFRSLVEERLGIKIVKATPLKEKMQTTVELEMDFFYKIETDTGDCFILHLEFESGDNPEMIYRISEYHGMALKRYKLEIKHLVIYLGSKEPKMRTELPSEQVFQGFDLLNVQSLDTEKLLSSQIPETVLIAVLANYPPEEAETILRRIIINLKKLVHNKRVLKKYINQLMMLSRLRKIESLTIKIAEEMPIHFDYETDTLYLKGTEQGIEKGKIEGKIEGSMEKNLEFTKNLLLNTDFTTEKIALLVGVEVEYVQKVKLDLEGK